MRVSMDRLVRRHREQGQSTVEFMLMVPVLFAIFFFIIEMGLYFTTVHYGTYAAFATARSQEGNFNPAFPSTTAVSNLILTGDVWKGTSAAPVSVPSGSGDMPIGAQVTLTNFKQKVPFPFIRALLPSMTFSTQANLGPPEVWYEGVENRPPDQYDNNNI